MRAGTHPDYRPVVFEDMGTGDRFITRSTVETNDTTVWEDGATYPLQRVEVTAASHPFFTGKMRMVDTAGRVERFERKYGKRAGRRTESGS